MPDQEKRNFIIGIVVVAIAILFTLWLMLAQIFGWRTPSLKPTGGVVTNYPTTVLPQGFPSSTPFLSVVEADESFNVTDLTTMQAGRAYISSMPLLQVFTLYKQFFSQTGWTLSDYITGNIAQKGTSFVGTKGSETVLVRLMLVPKNQQETEVYITYTFPK